MAISIRNSLNTPQFIIVGDIDIQPNTIGSKIPTNTNFVQTRDNVNTVAFHLNSTGFNDGLQYDATYVNVFQGQIRFTEMNSNNPHIVIFEI